MSQSMITRAFEAWLTDKTVMAEPAVPDTMIFAYIDGQSAEAEIDPDEGMPAAAQIVHSSALTRTAKINDNSVVYSVVLDTTFGDWSYNWVGLADSETGTVLMIVHCDEQRKIKTAGGRQGNGLIRNMTMTFTGAAEATQITVTPESWQMDYSARHAGADERTRTENIDVYGPAAFDGDGFLVTGSNGQYTAAAGLGYVSGLRCEAAGTVLLPAVTGAAKVWIDATWQGSVTGAWAVSYSLRVADDLQHYEKDGFLHYVFAIASINAAGAVTDLRPPFPLQQLQQQVDGDFLRIKSSLSEIANAGAAAQKEARNNIDVLSSAAVSEAIKKVSDKIDSYCPHKIGDVLTRGNNNNPAADWPGTTWQDLAAAYGGRTVAIGAKALKTGGSDTATMTAENMPAHRHGLSGASISESGEHVHTYYRYMPNGTDTTTKISIDDEKHGGTLTDTGRGGKHSHTLTGTTDSAGADAPAAFSIVSAYVQLRMWMRTA